MRAAVLVDMERIEVQEMPDPECHPDGMVLRVEACAICGTDVRTYHHGDARVQPPTILGHELSGVIAEVGERVAGFSPGDRVAVAPAVGCGRCYYCVRAVTNMCLTPRTMGYEFPGGFAELCPIHPDAIARGNVNPIPEGLSFEEAAIAEPCACAINAQELAQVGLGDVVVVIGAGPAGCMHIGVAKSMGASKVIVCQRSEYRLEMAKQFGADLVIGVKQEDPVARVMEETGGRGADVVMIAAPSAQAQEWAIQMAAKRGRVNFFAGLPKSDPYIKLNSNLIHYREIFVSGTHASTPRQNRIALELIASGHIDAARLITHRFPLDGLVEGIGVVESGKGLKVVVHPAQ